MDSSVEPRPTPDVAPVTRRTVFLAGLLDQLVFVGVVLLGIGGGLLASDHADGEGPWIAIGVAVGIGGLLVCLAVQTWAAVRYGATAGLFLLGARFDPSSEVHWLDDALDWLVTFWQSVVLAPLVWLLSRRDGDQDTGIVADARARTGAARLGRAALAVLLVAAPVPFVLALLS